MVNYYTPAIQLIPKEALHLYIFPKEDVLPNRSAQVYRYRCLEKAVILGNGSKGKVRIVFQTTAGPKMVETTVWGVAEDTIVIKNGDSIPVHAIRDVGF